MSVPHDDERIPTKLARDLREAFGAHVDVPSSVDRAVAELTGQRPRLALRLTAAAAAVLVVGLAGYLATTQLQQPDKAATERAAVTTLREDVDGNGRVDILDAYRLALRLDAGEHVAARWDLDADGQVNRVDLDAIAARAVSIGGGR